jgi:hypothetical protein
MGSENYKLVYKKTGNPVIPGQVVPDFRGDMVEVEQILTEGADASKIICKPLTNNKNGMSRIFFPSVIDAEWRKIDE